MSNFPHGSRGGGIVIYVKNNIEVSCQTIDVNVSTFEFSCVRLGPDKSSITLLCLYRPQSADKNVFCTELKNLVNLLPSAPNNLIIYGDYNIDALIGSNHFTTLVFTHLINNAYPVIFHLTRVTPSSVTLIDHTFCNFEPIIASGVLTEKISDHYITFITVKSPLSDSVEHNTPIYKLSRSINNRGLKSLRINLMKYYWFFITKNSKVDDGYDKLISIINELLNTFLPQQKVLIKNGNDKSWITISLRTSCKHKNKLYKLTCQNKYPEEQYVLYRNKLTSLIRQSKINYYTMAFAENAKNSKIAWKL